MQHVAMASRHLRVNATRPGAHDRRTSPATRARACGRMIGSPWQASTGKDGPWLEIAAGGTQAKSPARAQGRRRAAGIYGAIITAAILDTASGRMPTSA